MTVFLENPTKSTEKKSQPIRFQSVGRFQDTHTKIDIPSYAINNQ